MLGLRLVQVLPASLPETAGIREKQLENGQMDLYPLTWDNVACFITSALEVIRQRACIRMPVFMPFSLF